MYFLPHLYNTTDHMINRDNAERNEFIDISSNMPSDLSKGFGNFSHWLMKDNSIAISEDVPVILTDISTFLAKSINTYRWLDGSSTSIFVQWPSALR